MMAFLRVALVWMLMASGALACAGVQGGRAAEAALLAAINAERSAQGLPAWALSGALTQAAEMQACDMARHNYFGHQRAGGPDLAARVESTGYPMRAAGENLAWTQRVDPAQVIGFWRDSAGHRATMLNPRYREVGLAIAQGNGRIYWAMVAGR
jgi:uncharacterized protein YkwD